LKRIYINMDACMGCGLCGVFCTVQHSRSKDIIKAYKAENPPPVSRLRVERRAEIAFSLQCRQCTEPWCAYYCLTGAMHRDRITGRIVVDQDKCMGCWTCLLACPFGLITREKTRNVVAKCDLCQGSEIPACVANCPNEALMVVEEDQSVEIEPLERVN
jgi:carbon-monoxide dehydrogenase iron sulfur subunit